MKRFGWLAIALTVTAAQGLAQQNPAPLPAEQRNAPVADTRSPYLMYSPFMRDAREYQFMSPLGFPAAETREVLFARARSVIARYEMDRSRQRLGEYIERQNRKFERSESFTAALAVEDEAWAAYQAAQASVLARLMSDETYRAHVALVSDLSAEIKNVAFEQSTVSDAVNGVDPMVLSMARTRLGYATRATELRAAALASDPAVVEAKAKLAVASARVRAMREDFQNNLRDDAAVLALREELHSTRTNAVATAAYEALARDLSRGAIRYAYNLMFSGRASYHHGFVDDSTWFPYYNNHGFRSVNSPVFITPVQNGYGFQRR